MASGDLVSLLREINADERKRRWYALHGVAMHAKRCACCEQMRRSNGGRWIKSFPASLLICAECVGTPKAAALMAKHGVSDRRRKGSKA